MIDAAPGVNLDDLHPIFRRRLDALAAAHPALSVVSGVRTKSRQAELYAAYLAGGTLAANPNRVLGQRSFFGDTFIAEGSWHMIQPTGYGYAADLAGYRTLPNWDAIVPWASHHARGIPAPFGLVRTVEGRSPEPWHVQPLNIPTHYDEEHPLMALTDAEQADLLARAKRIDGELDQVLSAISALASSVERLQERVTTMDDRVADKGVKLTQWQRDDLATRIKGS
jgi:hypothetical protein